MKNALAIHNADGITITVKTEAHDLKRSLLANAQTIKIVEDDFTANIAAEIVTGIKRLRNEVESSRKEIKKPILEIGRRIDDVAKTFAAELEAEQKRIARRLIEYTRAEEEARRKAAEEARRKAQEAAEKARAEIEAQKAQQSSDVVEEIESSAAIEEATKARVDAEEEARKIEKAKTLEGSGVSFRTVVDFEVTDIKALVANHFDLVIVTPARGKIIAALKAGEEIAGIKKIERQESTIRGSR